MKNLHGLILFLLNITCISAMDLEMVTIKPKRFEKIPFELQIYNWPSDILAKIADNIIDLTIHEYEKTKECIDQKKYQKYSLNKLLLGIECAQEFHQLQKICQHEIGDKKFLVQELLILPRHEREVFMRMASRSMVKSLAGSNIGIDDFNKIKAIENENLKKGLKLKMLIHGEMPLYGLLVGYAMILQWVPMVIIVPTKFSEASDGERLAMYASFGAMFGGFALIMISAPIGCKAVFYQG
jgi:hypothetical protein